MEKKDDDLGALAHHVEDACAAQRVPPVRRDDAFGALASSVTTHTRAMKTRGRCGEEVKCSRILREISYYHLRAGGKGSFPALAARDFWDRD